MGQSIQGMNMGQSIQGMNMGQSIQGMQNIQPTGMGGMLKDTYIRIYARRRYSDENIYTMYTVYYILYTRKLNYCRLIVRKRSGGLKDDRSRACKNTRIQ